MDESVPGAVYRGPAGRRSLPSLDDLHVASPCSVPWDSMSGNGRVRSCRSCAKQVFNISSMTRADAEVLLRERVDGVCVRFYRRFDGTILTTDCPEGIRSRISGKALASAVVTAVLGFLALVGLQRLGTKVTTSVEVGSATTGFACATPRSDR